MVANNHRPNWNGNKQARTTIMLIASHLSGYKRTLCCHANLQMTRTACTLVANDYGYKKVPGIFSLENWLKKIETSVRNETVTSVFCNSHKGKKSVMKQITLDHPTYLHELWCYATNLLVTFSSIDELMNQKSAVNLDLPMINITCLQLYWWFKKLKERENGQGREHY